MKLIGMGLGVALAWLVLVPAALAQARPQLEPVAKELSGMSIVGNNETPKSLTIVPWRNAEVSKDPKLNPSPLNEKMAPVDRDVFSRELGYYKLSNPE